MARFRDRSHVDISFYRLYSKAPPVLSVLQQYTCDQPEKFRGDWVLYVHRVARYQLLLTTILYIPVQSSSLYFYYFTFCASPNEPLLV